jgi:glyoxylase-like metal-dependent hydrolase (beta-lactamase superfamily II)
MSSIRATIPKIFLFMTAAPLAVMAQTPFNARIDSTVMLSPTARSALEGRAVLANAITAAGGLNALRALKSISTDRAMLRTSTGQGLHPGAPAVEHAILLTRLDLRSRRAFTLRDLEIDGGQIWGTSTIVAADTGYDINYANRTYFSRNPAQYGNFRTSLLRSEIPTLLLSAANRPEQLRSMGRAVVGGRVHDAIAFADADGVLVTLFFDRTTHLLARSELVIDDPTRGDAAVTTDYSDYRAVGALRLPFRTDQDGPGPERWRSTVTHVELDVPLADSLFVPPQGLALSINTPPITKLADGVYALPAGVAIEFDSFVLVFEAYGDNRRSEANIARIRSAIPSKPIRYVVSSHYHEDHLGGVREYAALGATFITTRDVVARLEGNLHSRHAMRPDSFSIRPRRPDIEIVDTARIIEDRTRRLELYQIGPTAHVDRILIGYLPKERILIEGDLLDIPGGKPSVGGEDTEQFADKIRALRLDVARIVPIHGSPATGTMQDLERAVAMHRARAKCSPELVTRLFCDFWKP